MLSGLLSCNGNLHGKQNATISFTKLSCLALCDQKSLYVNILTAGWFFAELGSRACNPFKISCICRSVGQLSSLRLLRTRSFWASPFQLRIAPLLVISSKTHGAFETFNPLDHGQPEHPDTICALSDDNTPNMPGHQSRQQQISSLRRVYLDKSFPASCL